MKSLLIVLLVMGFTLLVQADSDIGPDPAAQIVPDGAGFAAPGAGPDNPPYCPECQNDANKVTLANTNGVLTTAPREGNSGQPGTGNSSPVQRRK